jgi:pyruvate,water dikinase
MSAPAIYVNLSVPRRAVEAVSAGADGVGLMRAEFLVYRSGRHPRLLITDAAPNDLGTILADGMRSVARAMHPRPVLYRSLDLRSNDVSKLLGGAEFEDGEDNPALGCRGMTRARRDPDVFLAEIAALARVRSEGYDNLQLLLPFVRWPEEIEWARECLEAADRNGASQVRISMMVETPGVVLRAKDFAPLVDGVSIGSNDLTQLILGIDRDNIAFAQQDWDEDPAVLSGIEWAVRSYRDLGVPVGICGDGPSRSEELLRRLLGWGMASISVSLDRVEALRTMVQETAPAEASQPAREAL